MAERTVKVAEGGDLEVGLLERIWKIKKEINELTGIVGTKEQYDSLTKIYNLLDDLLSPICPECRVKAKRFITSPAQLYDPAMAELPGGTCTFWTGEWYCPKCRRFVAAGEKWWSTLAGSPYGEALSQNRRNGR